MKKLILVNLDLFKKNLTEAYWQNMPHFLSKTQSPILLIISDIAIIGSRITGTSVANLLLERRLDTHITILEARTLCSGATG